MNRNFPRVAAGCWMVSSFGGVLPARVMALYPTIQPPGRFLTGVWLWRMGEDAV